MTFRRAESSEHDPIARPLMGDEEEAAVLVALYSTGWFRRTGELRALRAFCGVVEAVAVSPGTAVLMTALSVRP
jgi:dTDP-4-amino-4,6-dideoxygalactose transaminase